MNNLAIPEKIKQLANSVRNSIKASTVRDDIANSMEETANVADESDRLSKDTAGRQNHLETRYDVAVGAHTEDAEVLDARVDADGHTHENIKKRSDRDYEELNSYEVLARRFGVRTAEEEGYENYDNHDAILAAVDFATRAGNSAIIKLPPGTIKTSPVSFEGYDDFKFIGSLSRKFRGAKRPTLIQFIEEGDVGFKFSDTTNPNPEWMCKGVSMEGINFHGGFLVETGINGNYDLELDDINVNACLGDGIVIEDLGYPVHFHNVQSSWNRGNGIVLKGPRSTKMDFYRVECISNDGYGIVSEGGASQHFMDCTVQGNKRGGLKIIYKKEYGQTYYLQDMLFTNFYVEDNGNLSSNDPNYEGNWGVLIASEYGEINERVVPKNIRFNGGILNQSKNGGALKVDAVSNLFLDIHIPQTDTTIEIDPLRTSGVEFSTKSQQWQVKGAGQGAMTSYYTDIGETPAIAYNGGIIASRGRIRELHFYIDSTVGTYATFYGKTAIKMPSFIDTEFRNGYPVFKTGSLYGISVRKVDSSGASGVVDVIPTFATNFYSAVSNEFIDEAGEAYRINLDTGNEWFKTKYFGYGTIPLSQNMKLGVKLKTGSQSPGHNDGYIITLLVEY